MPHFTVNGVNFHVEARGTARMDRTLLMLHGFMGRGASWSPHMPALSAVCSTLALDLIGHGLTESPDDAERYTMQHCSDDLAAFLDQLGLQRVSLLGYSMGGRAALHFALTYPKRVAALVLESASPGLADPAERQTRLMRDSALAARLQSDGLPAFVEEWERLPLFASQDKLPAAVQSKVRAQRLANNALGLANSLRGMGTGVQPSLWDRLGELKVPTLLIAGALDEKFMRIAQNMAKQIPGARVEIVADAGHNVHVEKPAAFDHLVLDFLLAH